MSVRPRLPGGVQGTPCVPCSRFRKVLQLKKQNPLFCSIELSISSSYWPQKSFPWRPPWADVPLCPLQRTLNRPLRSLGVFCRSKEPCQDRYLTLTSALHSQVSKRVHRLGEEGGAAGGAGGGQLSRFALHISARSGCLAWHTAHESLW